MCVCVCSVFLSVSMCVICVVCVCVWGGVCRYVCGDCMRVFRVRPRECVCARSPTLSGSASYLPLFSPIRKRTRLKRMKITGLCPDLLVLHRRWTMYTATRTVLGGSGGVVNSLEFCPASLKSLGCFYFRCGLSHFFFSPRTRDLLVRQKTPQRHFFPPSIPFPR